MISQMWHSIAIDKHRVNDELQRFKSTIEKHKKNERPLM